MAPPGARILDPHEFSHAWLLPFRLRMSKSIKKKIMKNVQFLSHTVSRGQQPHEAGGYPRQHRSRTSYHCKKFSWTGLP